MKRWLIVIATVITLALTASSCDTGGTSSSQQSVDQSNNNTAAARLHKAYPYPVLRTSSELENETKRYHVLNDDPNRISYIMLFLQGVSTPLFEYQIIGKVSSTDSLYSSPASTDCSSNGVEYGSGAATCAVVPAAQPDGSYGANEPGIYFFVNNANHSMVEWSGIYNWSSDYQPYPAAANVIYVIPNGK